MKTRCPHCRHEQDVDPAPTGRVAGCPSCRRRYAARVITPDTPSRRRRSGWAGPLVLLVLIVAGAFGYVFWKQQASPVQLVREWLDHLQSRPDPDAPPSPKAEMPPEPDPAPDELVAQVPTPPLPLPAPVETETIVTPVPSPAAPSDRPAPLAWLLADQTRWPRQVTLKDSVRFTLKVEGRAAGSLDLPPGRVVTLTGVDKDYVIVTHQNDPRVITIESTDLLERARAEMNRRDTLMQQASERTVAKSAAIATASATAAALAALPPADPLGRIHLTSESLPPYRNGAFVHPGTLHTAEDLKRMATRVTAGQQPWKQTWDMLESSRFGLGWRARPVERVIRGIPGSNYTVTQLDANAAHQCALRYKITGDTAQADKAIYILKAWSDTMKHGVGGNSNFALGAGIIGYEFACAGDLLRGYPGWKQKDFDAYKDFLRLFLAGNRDFLVRRNGTGGTHYRLNWDTCNMLSMISIAVVLDEPATFDEAITYFLRGIGNGCIDRAIWYVHPDGSGQTEEMGRDQPHNVSGLEWMALFCQVAWNQGIDLYGYDNNRLLRGFEYVTRYNLGDDSVPYAPHTTYHMKHVENPVSPSGRGTRRAELVYNHYVNRRGLAAPFLEEAALKDRPVGGPHGHPSAYDFFGFSTLTYTLPPIEKGAPPSGLRAVRHGRQIDLSWWGSARAKSYLVKRASGETAPFATLATLDAAEKKTSYTDTPPDGDTFRYQIDAVDASGRELTGEPLTVRRQLIARFPFDHTLAETDGPRVATHSGKPAYTPGPLPGSQALVFDGESDFVRLPRAVADTRDITVAAWVYWNGGAPYQRIFDFGGDITKCFWLSPDAAGQLRFTITTTRGMDGTSTLDAPRLKTNQWVHVAVTLSGDTGTLYVNGRSAATGPVTLDPLFTQNHCYIGKSQYPDPLFKGKIADFRIYNHALPPADIAALHAQRR
jgi:hypothetical protein